MYIAKGAAENNSGCYRRSFFFLRSRGQQTDVNVFSIVEVDKHVHIQLLFIGSTIGHSNLPTFFFRH